MTSWDEPLIDPFDHDEVMAKQMQMALDLKRQGYDHFEIARKLTKQFKVKITARSLRLRIQEYWKQVEQESCEEHLRWEIDRLDDMLRRTYGVLDDPKDNEELLKAVDRVLKIGERRSKLLGLDAAQKVDATVTDTTPPVDERLAERLAEARARLRGGSC